MNWSLAEEHQMLVIPLKVSRRYDIHIPLATWIDSEIAKTKLQVPTTSQECRRDLVRLSSIRNCISSSICAHYAHKGAMTENALKDCMEYHAVLEECENCGFPTKDGEALDLQLEWACAFERDGKPMIRSNVRYERVCILFNAAALESYLASKEDMTTKAGLALSVKKYNTCAGIFHHIYAKLLFESPEHDPNPSNDLSPPCLKMCEKLMLAQGQVCVYDMARIHTKAQQSVLAKLAMGAAELFGEALLFACDRMVQARITNASNWILRIKCQSATFRAVAEYHEAVAARFNKEPGQHGFEIARLQVAEKLCNDGIALAGNGSRETVHLTALKPLVVQRKIDAEIDNRELYRDLVPNGRALVPTPGRRMTKSLPLSDFFSPACLDRPIFTHL